jgi:hypothetical protein
MKHPVSNIKVCFDTFPDKNEEVYDKPEISLRLQKLINICYEKPSEEK